jgi:hypothetical protein
VIPEGGDNPLPFVPVQARGRPEQFQAGGAVPALDIHHDLDGACTIPEHRERFAARCAAQIVQLAGRCTGRLCAGRRPVAPPAPGRHCGAGAQPGTEAAAVRRAAPPGRGLGLPVGQGLGVRQRRGARPAAPGCRPWPSRVTCGWLRAALATRCMGLGLAELPRWPTTTRPSTAQRRTAARSCTAIWQQPGRAGHAAPDPAPASTCPRAGWRSPRRAPPDQRAAPGRTAAGRQPGSWTASTRCCAGWLPSWTTAAAPLAGRRAGAAPGKRRRPGAGGHRAQEQGPGVPRGLPALCGAVPQRTARAARRTGPAAAGAAARRRAAPAGRGRTPARRPAPAVRGADPRPPCAVGGRRGAEAGPQRQLPLARQRLGACCTGLPNAAAAAVRRRGRAARRAGHRGAGRARRAAHHRAAPAWRAAAAAGAATLCRQL